MVRRLLFAGVLFLAGAPALAADWSRAGGSLIVGAPPPAPPVAVAALSEKGPFAEEIEAAALAHGLDPDLLRALVVVESGFKSDALSAAGAAGLAQLMPATARELGVIDRLDPAQNLMGAAAYLARQIRDFSDIRLALAAYNAGPARVRAYGATPPIRETKDHVRAVTNCFLALKAGRSVRAAADCASSGED